MKALEKLVVASPSENMKSCCSDRSLYYPSGC